MKTMKITGLFLLVLLFSAPAFGQKASVVINQTTNSVAFTEDGELWGLKINGKQELPPNFKSIAYQNGLYILCDMEGLWNVADAKVNVILEDWFKCAGVKVTEKFVLFEKADGNKAIIYDRATWTLTTAKETTYDAMYEESKAKYAGQGTSISNYETAAEESRRLWNTQPRVVSKNGKQYIMFQDIEVGDAANIISLNKDYDADSRWYFKAKSAKSGNWGIVYITKENPTKALTSIAFKYEKIESANNGWQVLNCFLLDGTAEQIWYDGSTTAQKAIPVAQR